MTPILMQREEVERHIHARTGRRIRNLSIEMDSDRVVLRGEAASFYLKQQAQHGVLDLLPEATLENDIIVRRN